MNETDLVEKKKRITTVVKGTLAVGACVFVAPVVFLAIKGLVGFVIAGAIGLVTINLAPVIAEAIGNWRIKAIKALAAANPIETLQIDYTHRRESLAQFKEAIKGFDVSVKNFEGKFEDFKVRFPVEAPKFQETLERMKELLSLRRKKYKEADNTLDMYQGEIDKAKAIWEMGLEASKMNAAAGMKEDYMAKIRVETALDSVTSSLNTAMADLETSLIEEADEKALHAPQMEHKDVIDVPAIKSKERVSK